jgi:hypothetical protein
LGLFIFGNVLYGAHTAAEEVCHLAVDAVDLLAGGKEGLIGSGG